MGKDSLIKSTSKKKTVKKSTTAKKTAAKPKSAPKTKKVPAKKTPAKKTETKKTASTTKRSTKKTKASTSTPKQKAAALKKKKVTGENEVEVERKRELLLKTFDHSETSTKEPETGAMDAASPDYQIPPPPPPPVMTKGSDPMATTMKLCAVGFVLLIAIILKVSASNQSHYYLKPTKAGVEIWQGIFAPLGEDRLILLPGAEKPESIQAVYSKPEVYPLIFNYYVKKADELLEKPGMPDFEGIKINLDKALPYAATEKLRTAAKTRRNNIDVMILLYKTEVAVSKETIPDYEAALEYLKEAQTLDVDGSKTDLIKQKTESINTSLSKLKEAEEKAAEETPIQN